MIECWQPAVGVLAIRRGDNEVGEAIVVVNVTATHHEQVDVGLDDSWVCVLSTDYSGYHPSGSDTWLGSVEGGSALAAYSSQIFVRRTPLDPD